MDFQEDLMKLKPILSRASFRMRINIVYALLHLLAIAGIALGIGAVSNRLLKNETQNNLKQNIALASERLDALLDKIENASLHFTVTLPENCTDIWISPDIGARALNNANLYPSNKKIQIGDKMSVTSGFSGGLTSRAGYVVKDHSQLPDKVNNYLERLAKPYYAAAAAWLEQMKAAGIKLMIVSNNTRKRVSPFAASLGLPFVSLACKPLPWGIRKAARQLGVSRREFALVGDQLFTDRLGGALAGVPVLVVRPMAPEIKWGIKVRRHLEKPFVRRYYKKGGKLL